MGEQVVTQSPHRRKERPVRAGEDVVAAVVEHALPAEATVAVFFAPAAAAGVTGGLSPASRAARAAVVAEEREDAVLAASGAGCGVAQDTVVTGEAVRAVQDGGSHT